MAPNTAYHQPINCSSNVFFHGRHPKNAQDLKFTNPMQTRCTNTDPKTLVDEIKQEVKENSSNIFEAFHKYRKHYDRKNQHQPLKISCWTFLLNPNSKLDPTKHRLRCFPATVRKSNEYFHSSDILRRTSTHTTQ